MATGYWLLDHPNPHGPHYSRHRGTPLRAVMIHITAGLQDLDPPDPSAEQTARYASSTTRRVSWHATVDSDSVVPMLPASYAAWHVRTYYPWCYGVEICKRNTDWRPGVNAPEPWRTRTLTLAARHAGTVARQYAIPLRKITAAHARSGGRGFISHWELDETRRDDPGRYQGRETFPWDEFLRLAGGGEADSMYDALERGMNVRGQQDVPAWVGNAIGEVQESCNRLAARAADVGGWYPLAVDEQYWDATAAAVGWAKETLGYRGNGNRATWDFAGFLHAAARLAGDGGAHDHGGVYAAAGHEHPGVGPSNVTWVDGKVAVTDG